MCIRDRSWGSRSLVIIIGLATAFLGTLVHRTSADAKTSLAYAAQTQIGLIFAEIGFGWTTFALIPVSYTHLDVYKRQA